MLRDQAFVSLLLALDLRTSTRGECYMRIDKNVRISDFQDTIDMFERIFSTRCLDDETFINEAVIL